MRQVKMRYISAGLAPRRTKLEIPGWAGERAPRADGSQEQVWHCTPFTEGAQYAIEIFYPFDFELRAVTRGGKLLIEGDFGEPPSPTMEWPPFRTFGDLYYTHQVLLDINPGDGYAIRTEPHPRFYSDTTGTCPIAVPALIRNWWPMMFFMVFKSPRGGPDPHLPPRRADGADPGDPGDGRVRSRRDDRRGAGRARTAFAPDLRRPLDRHRRYGLALGDGHRVRRHLSPHGARREGQGDESVGAAMRR